MEIGFLCYAKIRNFTNSHVSTQHGTLSPGWCALIEIVLQPEQQKVAEKKHTQTENQLVICRYKCVAYPSDVWTCGTYLRVVHNIKFDLNAATIYGIRLPFYSHGLRMLNCFG